MTIFANKLTLMILFFKLLGQSFLKTGVTLAYFHFDGKVECVNDKLNSLHKGYLSIDAASLRSLGFKESQNS
jgi:hypothetical protein